MLGSVESVQEVDQLQTLVIGMQRCMPEREVYFGRVGGGDVVALPIILCPHGVLFRDGFIGRGVLRRQAVVERTASWDCAALISFVLGLGRRFGDQRRLP
jgi:hypothetical protein